MIIFMRLVIAVCIGVGLNECGLTLADTMFWVVAVGSNSLVVLLSYNLEVKL